MTLNQSIVNPSVSQCFEQQAQKTPELIALYDDKSRYSYRELNDKANQIAHWLMKNDVKAYDFVALLLEPSADFILCLLAIIKVGATYVPLDTKAPKARLQTLINECSPTRLITQETFKGLIPADVSACLLQHIHRDSDCFPQTNLQDPIPGSAPIYLMYTSGSTGKPKGVLIPHQAVVNLVKTDNYAAMGEGAIMGQLSNPAFDAATFEIWSALLNGGQLAIIPLPTRTDPERLKTYLANQPLDCLFLPTSFFHQLIKTHPDTLNSVKKIVFGGEQVNLRLLKHYLAYRKTHNNPLVLINGYGPTEATTFTCRHLMTEQSDLEDEEFLSIGTPITEVKTYVLDEQGEEALEGELAISGLNLALGYLSDSTKPSAFTTNPFDNKAPFTRLYKTGDKARALPSGKIRCLGRFDDQVKIVGFRVHLSEIEKVLMAHEAISMAAVSVDKGSASHPILKAYLVLQANGLPLETDDLRRFLSLSLPSYMIPSHYVTVDALPLTSVGKVDKKALSQIPLSERIHAMKTSLSNSREDAIKAIWENLLHCESLDVHKNLFDLGANSLLMIEACAQINAALPINLQIAQCLTYPTISQLSRFIAGERENQAIQKPEQKIGADIAVIGMSGRFPKANSIDAFWENLCQGEVCYERFNEAQLGDKAHRLQNNHFIPVKGILDEVDRFDAPFFGFNPLDASLTDPQHRLFLECSWEALEQAGLVPNRTPYKIAVFAGMADSTYLQENLLKNQWACQETDRFQQRIATSFGMLSTQVSYRFNLKGRSLNINTACSTGLVTIAQACQELQSGQSQVAIAGAVSIALPQLDGYFYKPGNIESADGQCRPFEARANGTVFSNGLGVVVLKRLQDAIDDNNTIFAVIKGAGVNNDGANKLGFTAPSVKGQIECIQDALKQANLNANDITLIEAHGTATTLGDVVEVEALSTVFGKQSNNKQFCALSAVKANIGHTDVAAGMASFIKAVLCLYHQKIPPMPNFKTCNDHIHLDDSPFYINKELISWQPPGTRNAGVSSFGVGGTNAHLILSEYRKPPRIEEKDKTVLIPLSAKTEDALLQNKKRLLHYLQAIKEPASLNLEDLAYTLQTGRESYRYRSTCVAKSTQELSAKLAHMGVCDLDKEAKPNLIFMFPGQGAQYPQMAAQLIKTIPFFADRIKEGARLAKPYLGLDVLDLILAPKDVRLHQTQYAQPALFLIEYALASLFIHLGIQPNAVIGLSLGEYTAATIAGIFSFEEALGLICQRGLLMASIDKGSLLAVECSKDTLTPYLTGSCELALHNATNQVVVAGNLTDIKRLEDSLTNQAISCQRLKVSHAFHSKAMDAIEKPFKALFKSVQLLAPKLPMISNLTGSWLSAQEAINSAYWFQQLRHTVQFCQGIETLLETPHPLFIEIGPGLNLTGFLNTIASAQNQKVLSTPSLASKHCQAEELEQFLEALGLLWQQGLPIHWDALYAPKKPKLIPLPTYAFQKQPYWIDKDTSLHKENEEPQSYQPCWSREPAYYMPQSLTSSVLARYSWILVSDCEKKSEPLATLLKKQGINPIRLTLTQSAKAARERIRLGELKDYRAFFKANNPTMNNPIVLHFSSYTKTWPNRPSDEAIEAQLRLSFDSLVDLTKAFIAECGLQKSLRLGICSSGIESLLGTEMINPVNASLTGACRVISQEHPNIQCKVFDLNPDENPLTNTELLNKLLATCIDTHWPNTALLMPLRNGYQWSLTYTPTLKESYRFDRLKDRGVYLITGGLGGIALSCCEAIVNTIANPTFILLSRTKLPAQSQWQRLLTKPKHPVYKLIKTLTALKRRGATLLTYSVDIGNYHEVNAAIQNALKKASQINGLLHTAGLSEPQLIEEQTTASARAVFKAKLQGTYHLIQALEPLTLDFVVMTSSLAALLGGYRQLSYASANASLDAFAKSPMFSSRTFVVSINWNSWREVGIAATAAAIGDANFLHLGDDISTTEGQALFLKSLQGHQTQIAISKRPLVDAMNTQGATKAPNTLAKTHINRDALKGLSPYRPAQNETESQLVSLWQEALGIENISINDNFFSLGGHSLKAIHLMAKVNQHFGCSLLATQLYQEQTIKQLALKVSTLKAPPSPARLIPLKTAIKKPPYLFLCHPISGLIQCFDQFVAQSELPFSIYGLQDINPSADFRSFNDLVASYVRDIQRVQPEGPYYLVGYSYGGALLHEIAYQLKAHGETINLLAFIDSWALNAPLFQDEEHFKTYLEEQLGLPNDLAHRAWCREQLLLSHHFNTLKQDLLLFKASELNEIYESIEHPTNGWSQFNKGQILCHPIACNHETILNQTHSIYLIHLIEHYLKKNIGITDELFKKYPDSFREPPSAGQNSGDCHQ